MPWTGPQSKQLVEALIHAFPHRADLAQMVRFGMELRLEGEIKGENIRELAFSLFDWADARDRVPDLLRAALEANPDNGSLRTLATEHQISLDPSHPPGPAAAPGTGTRIFLAYQHDTQPDQEVARTVAGALAAVGPVFVDEARAGGISGAQDVDTALHQAAVVLVFLSEQAVQNQMLLEVIEQVGKTARAGQGPVIWPVRLAYAAPFPYPLNTYLDTQSGAMWRDAGDTDRLIGDLRQAIQTGQLPPQPELSPPALPLPPPPLPFAQPRSLARPGGAVQPLERPDGTMRPQSAFYIERAADAGADRTIRMPGGVTLTIKGPRQMGKSSLLIRTMRTAQDLGKRTVFLDFQQFSRTDLADARTFLQQFCTLISERLDLDD